MFDQKLQGGSKLYHRGKFHVTLRDRSRGISYSNLQKRLVISLVHIFAKFLSLRRYKHVSKDTQFPLFASSLPLCQQNFNKS